MSGIPTPYTLLVREPSSGGEDAHGNPVSGWSDPFEWGVHAVAPGASEEPRKPNRDLSVIAWTIYAPAGYAPSARAQVALPWESVGGERVWHDIEGEPDDWTKGPWRNPVAGVVVELRRTEG